MDATRELLERVRDGAISVEDACAALGAGTLGYARPDLLRAKRTGAGEVIYGAGKDLDETFGLIETAEKAAEIYMKIAHLPLKNTITDEQMHQLEKRFNIKAREGYLE